MILYVSHKFSPNSAEIHILTIKSQIHSSSTDAIAFAQSNTALLRPATKAWSKTFRTIISEKCLLGVIISLKPSSSSGSDEPAVPIGYLLLSSNSDVEERQHRNAELGLEIRTQYQGKGYGTEAIRWALNWAFQTAGLHRVAVTCFAWNEGAEKLYKKLGFVREGRKREAFWFDGEWRDLLEFGMLEGEWRARGEVVKLME